MHCVSERAREYERQSLRQPRSAPQLRGARLCETALHESKPTHAPYASLPTASIRSSHALGRPWHNATIMQRLRLRWDGDLGALRRP